MGAAFGTDTSRDLQGWGSKVDDTTRATSTTARAEVGKAAASAIGEELSRNIDACVRSYSEGTTSTSTAASKCVLVGDRVVSASHDRGVVTSTTSSRTRLEGGAHSQVERCSTPNRPSTTAPCTAGGLHPTIFSGIARICARSTPTHSTTFIDEGVASIHTAAPVDWPAHGTVGPGETTCTTCKASTAATGVLTRIRRGVAIVRSADTATFSMVVVRVWVVVGLPHPLALPSVARYRGVIRTTQIPVRTIAWIERRSCTTTTTDRLTIPSPSLCDPIIALPTVLSIATEGIATIRAAEIDLPLDIDVARGAQIQHAFPTGIDRHTCGDGDGGEVVNARGQCDVLGWVEGTIGSRARKSRHFTCASRAHLTRGAHGPTRPTIVGVQARIGLAEVRVIIVAIEDARGAICDTHGTVSKVIVDACTQLVGAHIEAGGVVMATAVIGTGDTTLEAIADEW